MVKPDTVSVFVLLRACGGGVGVPVVGQPLGQAVGHADPEEEGGDGGAQAQLRLRSR